MELLAGGLLEDKLRQPGQPQIDNTSANILLYIYTCTSLHIYI